MGGRKWASLGGSGPQDTIPICSTMHSVSDVLGCHLDKQQLDCANFSSRRPHNVFTFQQVVAQQLTQHRAERQPRPCRSTSPSTSCAHTLATHTHCAMRWHNAVVSVSGLWPEYPFSDWAALRQPGDYPLDPSRQRLPANGVTLGVRGAPSSPPGLFNMGGGNTNIVSKTARSARRPEIPTRAGK